jgi:hypothetical protein
MRSLHARFDWKERMSATSPTCQGTPDGIASVVKALRIDCVGQELGSNISVDSPLARDPLGVEDLVNCQGSVAPGPDPIELMDKSESENTSRRTDRDST